MESKDISAYTPKEMIKLVRAIPIPNGTDLKIEDKEKYGNKRSEYFITCDVNSTLPDTRKYGLKFFKYRESKDDFKKGQFIAIKLMTLKGTKVEIDMDEHRRFHFTNLNSEFYSAGSNNE